MAELTESTELGLDPGLLPLNPLFPSFLYFYFSFFFTTITSIP